LPYYTYCYSMHSVSDLVIIIINMMIIIILSHHHYHVMVIEDITSSMSASVLRML